MYRLRYLPIQLIGVIKGRFQIYDYDCADLRPAAEDRYASLGMDGQRAVHAGSGTCHAPGHFGLARTVRRGLDEGLTLEQITRQAEKENGYHARIQAAEMIRALRNQDSRQ